MSNWKTMIEEALAENSEVWTDVESNTMTEADMAKAFYSDYGSTEDCAFTVWTARSVYFPICYDGAAWVGSVSRNPDGKPTEHQGGG